MRSESVFRNMSWYILADDIIEYVVMSSLCFEQLICLYRGRFEGFIQHKVRPCLTCAPSYLIIFLLFWLLDLVFLGPVFSPGNLVMFKCYTRIFCKHMHSRNGEIIFHVLACRCVKFSAVPEHFDALICRRWPGLAFKCLYLLKRPALTSTPPYQSVN